MGCTESNVPKVESKKKSETPLLKGYQQEDSKPQPDIVTLEASIIKTGKEFENINSIVDQEALKIDQNLVIKEDPNTLDFLTEKNGISRPNKEIIREYSNSISKGAVQKLSERKILAKKSKIINIHPD